MKRWSPRPVSLAILALSAVAAPSPGLGQSPPPVRAVPPSQQPAATTAPIPKAPATSEPAPEATDDPWEERKAQAREDVEFLEALKKAKQAEVHEAEVRVAGNNAWKVDHDRQKKVGILAPFQIRQAEIIMAEGQSQLEMKRVDLKNVEIRLARSRRRLKAVERSAAAEPEPAANEDRFRELEIKYDRLRSEFDRIKRYSDYSKDFQGIIRDPMK